MSLKKKDHIEGKQMREGLESRIKELKDAYSAERRAKQLRHQMMHRETLRRKRQMKLDAQMKEVVEDRRRERLLQERKERIHSDAERFLREPVRRYGLSLEQDGEDENILRFEQGPDWEAVLQDIVDFKKQQPHKQKVLDSSSFEKLLQEHYDQVLQQHEQQQQIRIQKILSSRHSQQSSNAKSKPPDNNQYQANENTIGDKKSEKPNPVLHIRRENTLSMHAKQESKGNNDFNKHEGITHIAESVVSTLSHSKGGATNSEHGESTPNDVSLSDRLHGTSTCSMKTGKVKKIGESSIKGILKNEHSYKDFAKRRNKLPTLGSATQSMEKGHKRAVLPRRHSYNEKIAKNLKHDKTDSEVERKGTAPSQAEVLGKPVKNKGQIENANFNGKIDVMHTNPKKDSESKTQAYSMVNQDGKLIKEVSKKNEHGKEKTITRKQDIVSLVLPRSEVSKSTMKCNENPLSDTDHLLSSPYNNEATCSFQSKTVIEHKQRSASCERVKGSKCMEGADLMGNFQSIEGDGHQSKQLLITPKQTCNDTRGKPQHSVPHTVQKQLKDNPEDLINGLAANKNKAVGPVSKVRGRSPHRKVMRIGKHTDNDLMLSKNELKENTLRKKASVADMKNISTAEGVTFPIAEVTSYSKAPVKAMEIWLQEPSGKKTHSAPLRLLPGRELPPNIFERLYRNLPRSPDIIKSSVDKTDKSGKPSFNIVDHTKSIRTQDGHHNTNKHVSVDSLTEGAAKEKHIDDTKLSCDAICSSAESFATYHIGSATKLYAERDNIQKNDNAMSSSHQILNTNTQRDSSDANIISENVSKGSSGYQTKNVDFNDKRKAPEVNKKNNFTDVKVLVRRSRSCSPRRNSGQTQTEHFYHSKQCKYGKTWSIHCKECVLSSDTHNSKGDQLNSSQNSVDSLEKIDELQHPDAMREGDGDAPRNADNQVRQIAVKHKNETKMLENSIEAAHCFPIIKTTNKRKTDVRHRRFIPREKAIYFNCSHVKMSPRYRRSYIGQQGSENPQNYNEQFLQQSSLEDNSGKQQKGANQLTASSASSSIISFDESKFATSTPRQSLLYRIRHYGDILSDGSDSLTKSVNDGTKMLAVHPWEARDHSSHYHGDFRKRSTDLWPTEKSEKELEANCLSKQLASSSHNRLKSAKNRSSNNKSDEHGLGSSSEQRDTMKGIKHHRNSIDVVKDSWSKKSNEQKETGELAPLQSNDTLHLGSKKVVNNGKKLFANKGRTKCNNNSDKPQIEIDNGFLIPGQCSENSGISDSLHHNNTEHIDSTDFKTPNHLNRTLTNEEIDLVCATVNACLSRKYHGSFNVRDEVVSILHGTNLLSREPITSDMMSSEPTAGSRHDTSTRLKMNQQCQTDRESKMPDKGYQVKSSSRETPCQTDHAGLPASVHRGKRVEANETKESMAVFLAAEVLSKEAHLSDDDLTRFMESFKSKITDVVKTPDALPKTKKSMKAREMQMLEEEKKLLKSIDFLNTRLKDVEEKQKLFAQDLATTNIVPHRPPGAPNKFHYHNRHHRRLVASDNNNKTKWKV